MITVSSFSGAGVEEIEDPSEISELVDRDGRVLWVDLSDATPDDFACVQEEFGLHHLAMEDAAKHGQRAKLERYPNHAFLVAYSASLAEVDLFIGPSWMITVRERDPSGRPWPMDGVRTRVERADPAALTVGQLVYLLLDELVDGYFEAADEAEDHLEELEDRVFQEEGGHEAAVQEQVFQVRRKLLQFRRAVAPLREVVNRLLRREVDWMDEESLVGLQDVYDHVLRIVDQIDAHRELLNNAVDAHLALIANRQNQVMKTMTSWGAILLGATLVAGIYGMNFEHMPELDWRLGYLWALGLMGLITIVGWRYFRRKGWL